MASGNHHMRLVVRTGRGSTAARSELAVPSRVLERLSQWLPSLRGIDLDGTTILNLKQRDRLADELRGAMVGGYGKTESMTPSQRELYDVAHELFLLCAVFAHQYHAQLWIQPDPAPEAVPASWEPSRGRPAAIAEMVLQHTEHEIPLRFGGLSFPDAVGRDASLGFGIEMRSADGGDLAYGMPHRVRLSFFTPDVSRLLTISTRIQVPRLGEGRIIHVIDEDEE